jgi:tetratricopeptide (TPR) repeat protein
MLEIVKQFSAFISYSHGDEKFARWIHSAIETYRVPHKLIGREGPFGPIGPRLPPVFRDRDELASSADLEQAVRDALCRSSALLLICSPRSVKSRWVNEEIRTFAAMHGRERIFCIIVEGEPHSAAPERECFPPALFEVGHHEPLAADLRPGQDGKRLGLLKILAGLLGVGFDELRQRDAARRQRQLLAVAVASTLGLLLASALAIAAVISRNEAVRQRELAERKTMTAERTVGFVRSLFEVSDPSEARGQSITAREILDKGAREISSGLREEPAVRAELGTTLGEVYGGLGLYREGDRLIREMMAVPHDDMATRTRQLVALGESQTRTGEYRAAAAAYRKALRLARDEAQPRPDLVPRILVGLGEALSALQDHAGAARAIEEGLRLDQAAKGNTHPDVARDLEARGLNAFYAKDLATARSAYRAALAIRVRAQGPNHPRVPEDLSALGAISYSLGDTDRALLDYRKALTAYVAVLGPKHPEVASTSNNIARILLERRRYADALPLLRTAVRINLAERGAEHDDLVFPLFNLALVEEQLGRASEAEALLERALKPARLHGHPALGSLLTELAGVSCRHGKASAGLALVAKARPILARDYPSDWREAWLDNTEGECLLIAGKTALAQPLLEASTKKIASKWPASSHFGALARARLAAPRRTPFRL